MKIAVQFFGALRTFQHCYDNLEENLLGKHEVTLFMHTWSTADHKVESWHGQKVSETNNVGMDDLFDNYGFSAVEKEVQKPSTVGSVISPIGEIKLEGMKSMLYSMQSVNAMREKFSKENNVEFDLVLVIRPDIYLQENLDIELFMRGSDIENSIFMAGWSDKLEPDFSKVRGTDLLFWGKPSNISKLYDHNEQTFAKMCSYIDDEMPFTPEHCLVLQMLEIDIKPVLINYLMPEKFRILRQNDELLTNS